MSLLDSPTPTTFRYQMGANPGINAEANTGDYAEYWRVRRLVAENNLINFDRLGLRLAGGDVKRYLDNAVTTGFGDLVVALVGLGLGIWLCHFLYRKKIFLRL